MTEPRYGRRYGSLLVLAPVTAGVLGLSANWAIQHNPLDPTGVTTISAPAPEPPRTRALERRLESATGRYEARRLAFVDLQRSLRDSARRLASLQTSSGQTSSGQTSSGQTSSPTGSGAQPPAAPAAPPAAVPQAPAAPAAPPAPPPPPVDTTTGAS